jgi:hypothetical protein
VQLFLCDKKGRRIFSEGYTADVFLLRNITATKDTKDPEKITEFYVYITRSSYQITKRRIIHTFLPPPICPIWNIPGGNTGQQL